MLRLATWLQRAPVARLRSHLALPLNRNGYALTLSGAITSALGVIYWVLAARYYTPEHVGLNSALISAMLFLAGSVHAGLNGALIRFVPVAGRYSARLIAAAYAAGVIFAALAALIFALGSERWAPALSFVASTPAWLAVFVASVAAWCLFTLQDSALTALRQALWIPLENALYAVAKLALLVGLASRLSADGIFVSWVLPAVLCVVVVNSALLARARAVPAAPPSAPLTLRPILNYIAGNYLGSWFFVASTTLLPVLVTNRLGAGANAYFFMPWLIASSLSLIGANMATSFVVEASLEPSALRQLSRRVLRNSLQLLVPAALVVGISAPYLLAAFGQSYSAEGTRLLQLLVAASLPNLIYSVCIGLLRVRMRVAELVLVQGAVCVGVLGLSWLLLPPLGVTGVGVAWLMVQTAAAGWLAWAHLRARH